MSDAELRAKLRKIEALFAGAKTHGEKAAAGAAAERIKARLHEAETHEPAVECKYSIPDPWSRQLFVALARRYGLRPYRYPRMQRQTIMLRGPASFLDRVFWPQFEQIDAALTDYIAEVTDKVIREEVFGESAEVDEVPQIKHRR